MRDSHGTAFEPATGDGPPSAGSPQERAGAVRTAFEGLLQIRRLTRPDHADPEGVPAEWELHRPVRAVSLVLESAGIPPSATGESGERVATGYRVSGGGVPGAVRVEWSGPPGSGAVHDEEEALGECLQVLRRSGWTALLYRGPRRRRYLEVEPPKRPVRGAAR
ncbi:hypothetical protein CP967_33400 [Streptomyces nitrosporeus]|uniref:Uncharacterized protein n=1 Tax=Streptomyces nitrosporeus TaxID=28894 RepID=A0A5J6FJ33_9ACTN|nr:hypothetical protein [Streptomyces nitrosporeus]QEU76223.1 hypothetical protein CP967_33400 [Streptomyces nitrosporeus]GGZ08846.1 hypothetical protein GCM10010327_44320 [Streptomyces nitrosporeus]